MPRVLGFALFVDDIPIDFMEMVNVLRRSNIECVPLIATNKKITKKTKEEYSAASLLANVPSKGLVCTNRQKSLSFLL